MKLNQDGSARLRRGEARAALVKVLSSRAGELVDVHELATATDMTTRQVVSALHAARAANEALRDSIDVIVRGQTWRWRAEPATRRTPPAPPSTSASDASLVDDAPTVDASRRRGRGQSQIFHRVGRDTPDGEVILRDENECLWRARRLT